MEVLRFGQEDFDAFGRISGDLNPIHTDPGFAASTRFGRTVAHGMMLFGVVAAALARREPGPVTISGADLRFPAPTYAGVEHRLQVGPEAGSAVDVSIVTTDGIETLDGRLWQDGGPDVSVPDDEGAAGLGSLRIGDEARLTRRFTPEDTASVAHLVGDPNPVHRGDGAILSPALLGGLVSCLLGMHLPGPGTNWLKQSYRFHRCLPSDSEVTGRVRIVRLRPEKHLVDLAVEAELDGEVVMSGRSLVLVRDVG